MNLIQRLVLFLFIVGIPLCGWCQSKASVSSRLKVDRVTARLNSLRWQGKAFGVRESRQENDQQYNVSSWFNARFITYLPYPAYSSQQVITDRLTQLVVSQWLHISHVPTTVGIYNLSDSTTHPGLLMNVRYDIREGGDAVSDPYYLSGDADNWIQIITYDLKSEIITGAFNLKLTTQTGKVAYFKRGRFKIRLVYEFIY